MTREKREKPDTWMPFVIGRYLADTGHLTTEQHGAYFLMLIAAWPKGGKLPNDDTQLAAITRLTPARWRQHRAVLLDFWSIADDFIVQGKLTKEYAHAVEVSATKTENGKKGGRPRKQNETESKPAGFQNDNQNESESKAERNTAIPIPVDQKLPVPSEQAQAAKPDSIWDTGKAFLIRKGVDAKQAGSWLGKLRKDLGDVALIALLADAQSQDISDPIPWLAAAGRNALARKAKPGAADDFRGKSYDATPDDELPDGLR